MQPIVVTSVRAALMTMTVSNSFIAKREHLLYRLKSFTGKYTTRKIHNKQISELEWCIFHILMSEDINDFSDIKFVVFVV